MEQNIIENVRQDNEYETENDPENDTENEETEPEVFYSNLEPLINNNRGVNFYLIVVLGTLLSLDEMMIILMLKYTEKHQTNNNPISEGFKLFYMPAFIVLFSNLLHM